MLSNVPQAAISSNSPCQCPASEPLPRGPVPCCLLTPGSAGPTPTGSTSAKWIQEVFQQRCWHQVTTCLPFLLCAACALVLSVLWVSTKYSPLMWIFAAKQNIFLGNIISWALMSKMSSRAANQLTF